MLVFPGTSAHDCFFNVSVKLYLGQNDGMLKVNGKTGVLAQQNNVRGGSGHG